MSDSILFTPYRLGRIELKNRVVMAPMTRNRSPGGTPGASVVTYYAQRAEAGLIVTEGTAPAPEGIGYARIPGIYNDAQAAGWRHVVDAVHHAGGKIFVQLMHTGRASHPDNLGPGVRVLAPSAVALGETIVTDTQGPVQPPVPEAMTEADIEHTLEHYAHASELAVNTAGFDGVELHGANGYLIDQFLNTVSNQRTDAWGGSVENRIRFAVEVARRVASRIGSDRVGIRVSPFGAFNKMQPDDAMEDLYATLAHKLSDLGLVYIHVVDHSAMGAPPVPATTKAKIRQGFRGTYILSGGYDRARAASDLTEKRGDLVAFGRPFLANPRLVSRLKSGATLAQPDFSTLYTPGDRGYIDYPVEG